MISIHDIDPEEYNKEDLRLMRLVASQRQRDKQILDEYIYGETDSYEDAIALYEKNDIQEENNYW